MDEAELKEYDNVRSFLRLLVTPTHALVSYIATRRARLGYLLLGN